MHAEQVATNQRLDATNQRLDVTVERLDLTIERLDIGNQRLDTVESTLLDLVVVRYTRALAEGDGRLERRVDELEIRVEKLETE
jgi:vacuolar-type H+-ATPase subunit I/STV1